MMGSLGSGLRVRGGLGVHVGRGRWCARDGLGRRHANRLDLHREYYDEHPNSEPLDPRLGEAVEAATVRIRSGSDEAEPGEGNNIIRAERQRAADIISGTFFEAWDAVATDGYDDYPEALPESINGAYRDILGEFAPSELFNDPGALIEAVDKLGISTETRQLPNGRHEIRWICTTCGRAGEWEPSRTVIAEPIDAEHAAWHTVREGS